MNRLQYIVDLLENGNVSQFEKNCGFSATRISKAIKRNSKIDLDIVQPIVNAYPQINGNWLEKGVGKPIREISIESADKSNPLGEIKGKYQNKNNDFYELPDGKFLMRTRLVNVKAQAGYLTGWGDPEFIEELPDYFITTDKAHKGTYRSFEVSGDSMFDNTYDSIKDGDIVTGRKIDKTYWKSKLHHNAYSNFVIVTLKGVVTKQIINHDVENGIITCHSLNPDKNSYPDFDVRLDEVIEIYNVIDTHHKGK